MKLRMNMSRRRQILVTLAPNRCAASRAIGHKVGAEVYYDEHGAKKWAWDHGKDGKASWTQYWPNGDKRVESHWAGVKADGAAKRWDRSGHIISDVMFRAGAPQK